MTSKDDTLEYEPPIDFPVYLGERALCEEKVWELCPPKYAESIVDAEDVNSSNEYLRTISDSKTKPNQDRKFTTVLFGFQITNYYKFILFICVILTLSFVISHISFKVLAKKAENLGKSVVNKDEIEKLFGSNEEKFRSSDKFTNSVELQQIIGNQSFVDECVKFINFSKACQCYKVDLSHISASMAIGKLKRWLEVCLHEEEYQKIFIYTGEKHELYEHDVHPAVKNWLRQKGLPFEDKQDHFVVYHKITV
ncbi:uncharacterized protein LOC142339116 isoform X2 [Convolutriloba macropyga]